MNAALCKGNPCSFLCRSPNVGGLLAGLNMMVMTAGGFDFTGANCLSWMR
jgi:hypothetical protein